MFWCCFLFCLFTHSSSTFFSSIFVRFFFGSYLFVCHFWCVFLRCIPKWYRFLWYFLSILVFLTFSIIYFCFSFFLALHSIACICLPIQSIEQWPINGVASIPKTSAMYNCTIMCWKMPWNFNARSHFANPHTSGSPEKKRRTIAIWYAANALGKLVNPALAYAHVTGLLDFSPFASARANVTRVAGCGFFLLLHLQQHTYRFFCVVLFCCCIRQDAEVSA